MHCATLHAHVLCHVCSGRFCMPKSRCNQRSRQLSSPEQPTFVRIDDQYADWYKARFGVPINHSMVLPVCSMRFKAIPNPVPCGRVLSIAGSLVTGYHGVYKGQRMLICRQVDDLAIGCADQETVRNIVTTICQDDGINLRDEGILTSFNGVDVEQSGRYTKNSCESYIDKFLTHYGWSAAGPRDTGERPIEQIAASTIQQMITDYATAPRAVTDEYSALESSSGFLHRSVLDALIYAYVMAQPDIVYAVTTLACFSDRPAKIHYDALRRIARYLGRKKRGVYTTVARSTDVTPHWHFSASRRGPIPSHVSCAHTSNCARWICRRRPRHQPRHSTVNHRPGFHVLRRSHRVQVQNSVDSFHQLVCTPLDCQGSLLHPLRTCSAIHNRSLPPCTKTMLPPSSWSTLVARLPGPVTSAFKILPFKS